MALPPGRRRLPMDHRGSRKRACDAELLARDLERERLMGDKTSPALMNANRLLAQGGLPALFKELDNPDAVLPMLFLGLGIPALEQAGSGND